MSVTTDIFASWRHPRAVVGGLLARERSEPFALSLLLTFLVLALVAALPNLARESFLDGGSPLAPRVLASAMGLLATLPLFYLLAAIGTLSARMLKAKGDHYRGRIALFWAANASIPAMLVLGLVQGLAGPGWAVNLLGLAAFLAFLAFWAIGLSEAGRGNGGI
jgi:hypothetical protein